VRRVRNLSSKFLQAMLLVIALIGTSMLAVVFVMTAKGSDEHLHAVQTHIEQGITSKGEVLSENHALALRGMALDNAFLDMQRLIERAVTEDKELVYGLYVNSEKDTLAWSQHGTPPSGEKPPDAKAWQALGIAEEELIVKQPSVRRARRLGTEVLEFAVPVAGEENEIIGTVRYGLSTERMRAALEQAQADARTRLRNSILLVVSLLGFSLVVGFFLSRSQAGRITKPIRELTRAAEKLSSGDRTVRVDISSRDEIEVLGGSFNRMVEDLDASYRALEEANRTLEQKVAQRTAELAHRNADMRLVLDNVEQGLATLSPDGTLAAERSRVLEEWFGELSVSRPFWEQMQAFSRDFALSFRFGFEQVADGVLPLEVAVAQLPERLHTGERTYSFRYLPIVEDEKLAGILLVVADVTERLLREREEAEQDELLAFFRRILLDRNGFGVFVRETDAMVRAVAQKRDFADAVLFKRRLHTLKGNTSSVGLVTLARACHALEDELAETGTVDDARLQQLETRWNTIREQVSGLLGPSGARVVEIAEPEFNALLDELAKAPGVPRPTLDKLSQFRLEPVSRPLGRLADQARALAKRLGRGDIEVKVESNGLRLDPDVWSPFFAELVHIVRNAVDHGLESNDDRLARGKPVPGTITLRASAGAAGVTFEIEDDGRGIDWEAIRELARSRGLKHATHADLVDALCEDGVSTRAVVTDASGRGVGMAALRQRIRSMSGQLELLSEIGRGTKVRARFSVAAMSLPKR
jgi:two-component system chemotaxis sensor kinase CheA